MRKLEDALDADPTHGGLGIAHTRWATHGVPSERNAHPHISKDGIAIVHNGIIENHEELREEARREGYEFTSETDTEVIAHRIHHHLKVTGDLFKAVRATVAELEGAYALAVVSQSDPDRIVVAREGCPVVIGLGEQENFVASDVAALLPVTRRFIFLEEGDVAEIRRESVRILDRDGNTAQRTVQGERALGRRRREGRVPALHAQGNPRAAARRGADARGARRRRQAARGRVRPGGAGRVREDRGRAHRGLRHQLPRGPGGQVLHRADLPPAVLGGDRERVPLPQPGGAEEHAVRERLAVGRDGRHARGAAARQAGGYLSQLAICNVPESSLVRESELVMLTRAGPEIGVASTKAFTTQLAALSMLVIALAKFHSADAERERGLVQRCSASRR